jgi:hypothetical protein
VAIGYDHGYDTRKVYLGLAPKNSSRRDLRCFETPQHNRGEAGYAGTVQAPDPRPSQSLSPLRFVDHSAWLSICSTQKCHLALVLSLITPYVIGVGVVKG